MSYWLLIAPLLLMACHRADPGPTDPAAQLPPATQVGAGTLGCLLNGQAWTPSGYDGRPNFVTSYDAGYAGGSLQIKCYRYTSSSTFQSFTFGAANVKQTGAYALTPQGANGFIYFDTSLKSPCNMISSDVQGTYLAGSLTVTRLDRITGVVSGTFSAKLFKPGCDTLRITQGRFDYSM